MSTDPFYIKRNDLQPPYPVHVEDSNGNAIDLTDATIYCTMKLISGGTAKINRQTAGINIIDPATDGDFDYNWQSGDTDTTGIYYIEFEINPIIGGKFTFPAKEADNAVVVIYPDLDAT